MRLLAGLWLLLGGLWFGAVLAAAQDEGVTADEINAVARQMYCPVCPNERLDTCMTEACVQWRVEIGQQLAAGRNQDEIVADFVARFGERASAVPLDPGLRALAVVTPFVLAGVALVVGVLTFVRWRAGRDARSDAAPASTVTGRGEGGSGDDAYRAQLERDVESGR
jgi:cytochrome c-type biogenesis protein CcmH